VGSRGASVRNTESELRRLTAHFGNRPLASITPGDVERFLRGLCEGPEAVTGATMNRYRDRISGLYKRAMRLGLVATNPAKGISKAKEPGARRLPDCRRGGRHPRQLTPEFQPLFAFSLHTGLRWSEQGGLRWADVDMLAGVITVGRSKNGHTRRVPLNSAVSRLLVDLGAARTPHSDPEEPIFRGAAYRTPVSRAFLQAVERTQASLRDAGKDASRLEGYTWHGNRHTFASRLVMAGVNMLTVQTLGGWRTPAMVQRYAHLAPDYLARAVERLVTEAPRAVELGRNLDDARAVEGAAP
jgi:integrase